MNTTTVFFDGSCPLCRREIALYQGLNSSAPIEWVDVSTPEASVLSELHTTTGKSPCELMARFHVQTQAGQTISGAEAFIYIWQFLPGWRWLAKLGGLPGALWLLEKAYNGFLKIRPKVQKAVAWWAADAIPSHMLRDIRTDHAGEVGAVWIYKGMLAASRDAGVREFASRHLQTERSHLNIMSELLPPLRRTKLYPIWVMSGFLTGFLPGLFGKHASFATIQAVETFVDQHYQQQITLLENEATHPELLATLLACQSDEIAHRDEAAALIEGKPSSRALLLWQSAIARGSELAVSITRYV